MWKRGKDLQAQDKIQSENFTKDPRPLAYKTPLLSARLRGRAATQRSKKGSEKVLRRF